VDWIQSSAWPWLQLSGWLWVERISWLVAIFGIPSLLLGLFSLGRRPSLAVGFGPVTKERRSFRTAIPIPQREIKALPATMFNIQFAISNIGRATARDLLVNYVFSNLDQSQVMVVAGAPQIAADPVTGRPLWILKIEHIHPGDVSFHGLTLHPQAGLNAVEIEYHVSMADARSRSGSLKVSLTAQR
jgi:hypothetical protein